MKNFIKIGLEDSFKMSFKECLKAHIRQWWYGLFVREDEFHKSLEMDLVYMLCLSEKEEEKYLTDLSVRREIAKYRSLR